MRTLWLWLTILCLATARAQPDLRAELNKAYNKATVCARLKYLDGMLSHRAPGFLLFDPEGARCDLGTERDRFRILFASATKVRLQTKVLKIQPIAEGAHVDVSQTLTVEQIEEDSRLPFTLVYQTRCIDTWRRTGNALRLTQTSVQNQAIVRGGPLRADI